MIKYDVYKNKRSGIYYCVNLMGGINERHLLLPDEPPYTLERSTWRAGDVITRPDVFQLIARNVVFKDSVCSQ